jgi:hypothetical protein
VPAAGPDPALAGVVVVLVVVVVRPTNSTRGTTVIAAAPAPPDDDPPALWPVDPSTVSTAVMRCAPGGQTQADPASQPAGKGPGAVSAARQEGAGGAKVSLTVGR